MVMEVGFTAETMHEIRFVRATASSSLPNVFLDANFLACRVDSCEFLFKKYLFLRSAKFGYGDDHRPPRSKTVTEFSSIAHPQSAFD
ncbi:hypothetical protein [Rhizobium bangladeshense]|uniref:hypothetical protein n=1 Tax=Rhizobium bangladeshense TaxID=1138189 RepID=UPI001C83F262|nr:hypothetical protein [Rhizobium bangladeshense]MBX4894167.1 hypothetical protein [Rhizobium bangladeshense]MBX4900082.1 hypothetical protein [Rhizobium bangladeshense]MBX4912283.1 hypothetical protein [Rhizobium bangladeshense]MBY3612133.1 hypothetical protein [Rhizobium bangladeshense]